MNIYIYIYIYIGAAGCGKTEKLCNMILKEKNIIMFSFMNKVVQNVKERPTEKIKNGVNIECCCNNVNKICYTFDS